MRNSNNDDDDDDDNNNNNNNNNNKCQEQHLCTQNCIKFVVTTSYALQGFKYAHSTYIHTGIMNTYLRLGFVKKDVLHLEHVCTLSTEYF